MLTTSNFSRVFYGRADRTNVHDYKLLSGLRDAAVRARKNWQSLQFSKWSRWLRWSLFVGLWSG